MMQFFLHEFALRWDRLEQARREFSRIASSNIGHTTVMPKEFEQVSRVNADFRFVCEHLELQRAFLQLLQFEATVRGKACNYQTIDALVENLMQTVHQETDEKFLALIPNWAETYFEKDDLFGELVNKKFPEAKKHIKDAGNCLASELYAATVFHLMCVAEIGLRGLAKVLKVKVVKRSVAIEFGTWEQVITALECKVNKKAPRTKRAQQQSDAYKAMLVDFRAFKDLWRNKVMHVRAEYDAHQAKSAFDHVCTFMQRLADVVQEK
jgi:hypothetical protein